MIAVRRRRRDRHDPVVRVRPAVAGVHGRASARCSGSAFALEGISFFVEAIFIAIYVYGWDRLSKRAHFLTGIPVVLSGFAGSFNVIAVNGWMNDPTGFDLGPNGEVLNPRPWEALLNSNMWHELIHMYLAGYLVSGFLVAGRLRVRVAEGPARPLPPHRARRDARVRLAGRAGAGDRRRLGGARGRRAPAGQARRDGGAAADARRARRSRSAASTTRRAARSASGSRCRSCSRCWPSHDPNATIQGLDIVPPEDRPPVNIVRYAFQTMVGIGTGLALLGVVFLVHLVAKAAAAGVAVVLPRGDGRRPAGVRRADRGLDHDRGRPPAVDRLRGDAHRGGGHAGRRARGRLRRAGRRLHRRSASRSSGCCGGSRASRRSVVADG